MKPSEMNDEQLVRAVWEEVMEWHLSTACTLRGEDNELIRDVRGCVIDISNFDPIYDANHRDMVVEAAAAKGFYGVTYNGKYDPEVRRMIAWGPVFIIWNPTDRRKQFTSKAETLGRQVCEAALEAVRREKA